MPVQMTLFYDGECPLCVAEMRRLSKADQKSHLRLIDINSTAFEEFPHIDATEASRILHGLAADNTLYLGLDATYHAWRLVGKGRWVKLTRLPGLKTLFDAGYRLFARHRYTISRWLTGQSRCSSGVCHKR
ncbi:thiol-disulfide oxidoreductase DCC family protein [Vibrio olivae]|uniref:Thiol-disulfide oxidoreductase DCC family protein n=1 Tax=Vibrio olivae TaxID=1243002 RepID=A0ABV5HMQ0_9VIBR